MGDGKRLIFKCDGTSCASKELSMVSKPHYKQSRPSDNSHGWLGAVLHQCHLIKACQALPQSYENSTGSWIADVAIYSYSVVTSGWCTSVTIKLVNKSNSKCAYMVDFSRLSYIYLCTCLFDYVWLCTCIDIDECLSSPCGHTCINTVGSFVCSCNNGYVLDSDGLSCNG